MTVLNSIFAVLAGLAFGSFLNVCISRLPCHESVVTPRSRCPVCLTPIRNWDNIPVLSWLVLHGRCRDCSAPIALRYPLIELGTAALFLLCVLRFCDPPLHAIFLAGLCWLMLGLAATDAETMKLPDAMTLPGLAIGLIYSALTFTEGSVAWHWQGAAISLLWAGCAAALILLIRGLYWLVRRREGIGLGDAKLLAMITAWLGWQQTLLVFFVAVIGAAFYGIALIARRREKAAGNDNRFTARIPLGAFLSAAGILAIFEGDAILGWYLQFFR